MKVCSPLAVEVTGLSTAVFSGSESLKSLHDYR